MVTIECFTSEHKTITSTQHFDVLVFNYCCWIRILIYFQFRTIWKNAEPDPEEKNSDPPHCLRGVWIPHDFLAQPGPVVVFRVLTQCCRAEALHTICPRSLAQFHIVSYYTRWVKTSWAYCSRHWFEKNADPDPNFRKMRIRIRTFGKCGSGS